jgi:hypothetical protein
MRLTCHHKGTMITLLSSQGATEGRTRWLLLNWLEDVDPQVSTPPLVVQLQSVLMPLLHLLVPVLLLVPHFL